VEGGEVRGEMFFFFFFFFFFLGALVVKHDFISGV